MNKTLSQNFIEKISPQGEVNGKLIELTDEICASWGFSMKKKVVSSLGTELAALGYEVTINHKPDSENIGVYKIFLQYNNQEILIYSKNQNDDNGQAVISNSPTTKIHEIIKLILSVIEEQN